MKRRERKYLNGIGETLQLQQNKQTNTSARRRVCALNKVLLNKYGNIFLRESLSYFKVKITSNPWHKCAVNL